MRHIHILDPQLAGVGGHYLSHDTQLIREVQRRGFPVSIHGRRQSALQTCCELTVLPTFTHDIFKEAASDPITWPMENFFAVNQAFLADLNALDPAQFASDDLVYFPNLLQNQVQAITLWLARLPAANRPTVALMFRYLNHAMDYVQQRQNKEMIALYYRFAVRQLLESHPRALICADTSELAKAYRQITSAPVLELPNPMDVSALLASAATRPANDRPVVVYQGHTSPLRGFHFLPDIIERCAALTPRPRFVIQVQNRDTIATMGLGKTLERLERFPRDHVELINGALSQSDYLALLARADVVLLPYTPSFYGHGSSGVFTEAASAGKVVVACQGTVPARQGRDYRLGVVAAEQWTPQAMSQAVAQALQQLPQLTALSAEGAPRFRQENCAEALWDKLLQASAQLPALAAAA